MMEDTEGLRQHRQVMSNTWTAATFLWGVGLINCLVVLDTAGQCHSTKITSVGNSWKFENFMHVLLI